VSYFLGDRYQNMEGHCKDLSEAGIGILLAAELDGGEVTGLSFSLPGLDQSWRLRAVVRYRRGYNYGFEFLSLAAEQQATLRRYVSGLQPAD
jgi:hypothetical protein